MVWKRRPSNTLTNGCRLIAQSSPERVSTIVPTSDSARPSAGVNVATQLRAIRPAPATVPSHKLPALSSLSARTSGPGIPVSVPYAWAVTESSKARPDTPPTQSPPPCAACSAYTRPETRRSARNPLAASCTEERGAVGDGEGRAAACPMERRAPVVVPEPDRIAPIREDRPDVVDAPLRVDRQPFRCPAAETPHDSVRCANPQ